MRISTSMLYDLGVSSINQQYSDLLKLQQQMSTGRRVLTPADDPIAAARALNVSQSQAVNEQFMKNGNDARSALELQESVLTSVTDLLQDARVLAVNAGNPGLNRSDLSSLARDLQERYNHLLGLANSTDSNGQYLFAGYRSNTQPFAETAPGTVAYSGDQGQRSLQVSASRQIAVSSSGADVFQMIRSGNGTFTTAAGSTNTGAGIVSTGTVIDPAAWAAGSRDFTLTFTSATTYDITDNGPPSSTLVSSATYTSGTSISVPGAQFSISGKPAAGDSFTLQASRTDQDIFSTLHDLITALNTPGSGTPSAGNAALTNSLSSALSNIDQALDKVLTVRTTVGASLREVDAHLNAGEEFALQYGITLSELQDLDYAKAISDMAQKQATLEAAQKSFLNVQNLSLFRLI